MSKWGLPAMVNNGVILTTGSPPKPPGQYLNETFIMANIYPLSNPATPQGAARLDLTRFCKKLS